MAEMTSIRHSDTPSLERRRELVSNELALIDGELSRRRRAAEELQRQDRDAWVAREGQLPPVGQNYIA
jgi:hypothetical protein